MLKPQGGQQACLVRLLGETKLLGDNVAVEEGLEDVVATYLFGVKYFCYLGRVNCFRIECPCLVVGNAQDGVALLIADDIDAVNLAANFNPTTVVEGYVSIVRLLHLDDMEVTETAVGSELPGDVLLEDVMVNELGVWIVSLRYWYLVDAFNIPVPQASIVQDGNIIKGLFDDFIYSDIVLSQ